VSSAGGLVVAVGARFSAVVGVGVGLNAGAGQIGVGRAIARADSVSVSNGNAIDALEWWWWASAFLVTRVAVWSIFILVTLGASSVPEARGDVFSDPGLSNLGTDGLRFSTEVVVIVGVEFRSCASESSIVTTMATRVVSISVGLALPSSTPNREREDLASVAWWDVANVDLLCSVSAVSVVGRADTVGSVSGVFV